MKRKSFVIWNLARANDKYQSRSNRIYIIAIAFTILILFSIFSIVNGKIETDQLRNMRKANTAANVSFSGATPAQYNEIKKLRFVKQVGIEKTFAGIYGNDNQMLFSCAVLDSVAYNEMLKPSCSDTVGKYPQKNKEIFMSRLALQKLGIKRPQIGMKIKLNIEWFDWMTNKEHANIDNSTYYVLSGFNTSYEDSSKYTQYIYFSQEFLKTNNIKVFPGKLYIRTKYDFLDSLKIERLLYENITLKNENQQFVVENSSIYQAMVQFAGGFEIVFACAVILCISAYLLMYNLVSISLDQNIKQYNLLETIGMTKKQIRNMIYVQGLRKSMLGSIIGGIISAFINIFFLQTILQKLYLDGLGKTRNLSRFSLIILFLSIGFVFAISLFSSNRVLNKLKILDPFSDSRKDITVSDKDLKKIEARRWKKKTESQITKSKKQSSKMTGRRFRISYMAWRNMKREKRKLAVSLLSLLLGCIVILGFGVLENGTDTMNQLKQNYDFEIGMDEDTVNQYLDDVKFDNAKQRRLFSTEKLKELSDLAKIKMADIKISQGGYAFIKTDEKDAFGPRNQSLIATKNGNNFVTFQIVTDEDVKKLENYKFEKNENIDLWTMKSGKGALLLHENELSMTLKNEAKGVLDKNFTINTSYVSMAENKNNDDILCSGYLDITGKSFPNLDLTYHGNGINYLLVTEKGFKQIKLVKQIFHISFNVQSEQETHIKQKLKEWVLKQNSENGTHFYIVANSDKIIVEKKYIQESRLIMSALGSFLLVMGILNYFNTKATDLTTRRSEFILLEMIGMTRKQLQKMILLEGIYFCVILWGLLFTIGNLVLWIFASLIKEQLTYFRFYYPIDYLIFIVFSFSLICLLLPQIYFRIMS